MKTDFYTEPRKFKFDIYGETVYQKDYSKIYLEPFEMVTFVTPEGKEHDVVGAVWGYWATQSINSRLRNNGFKTALVKSSLSRYYIAVVDTDKMPEFFAYLERYGEHVAIWLDETEWVK